MPATFPASIWDGDSRSRDSDEGRRAAPDKHDWTRMIAELAAVQKSNSGIDPDTIINSHGTLATVAGLTVREYGNAAVHKTVLTLDEVNIDTIDGSVPATDACWGTLPLYTFPEGHLLVHASHQVYPVGGLTATTGGTAGLSDTATLEIGVGSTARANATDFDLHATTTDDDIVPLHIAAALVAGASAAIESSPLAAALFLDGSAAAVVANLNVCGATDTTDHGVTADVLIVSGTITLVWSIQGNN